MPKITQMVPSKGDEIIIEWDENDPRATKRARKHLERLMDAKGIRVFAVDTSEQVVQHSVKGEQIEDIGDFDKAKSYLGVPAMAGG